MAEFLLEILSEEIPARMQAKAADDLARLVGEGLKAGGLSDYALKTHVTPRRLVLVIEGLPLAAADVSEERRGPRTDAPPAALEGFLKSTGLTQDQLEQRDTGKGVFYFALIARKGRATDAVLAEAVTSAMANFPWPKSMRWGSQSERWVRPIVSILALFNGAVVPVSFGAIVSGASTRGHRFMAPGVFAVEDYADYATKLRAAKVLIDPAERRHAIVSQAEALVSAQELVLKDDPGLADEVTGLVEWPVALMGVIDDRFMAVPAEVLTTSMRSHQKYFSVLTKDGHLAPRFIAVANIETADKGAAILNGNQRVLRARLSDAAFFWDTDRKVRLEQRLPKLADRLFYQGLGSMADKAQRIQKLAVDIATVIGADVALTEQAAVLAKADLSSEMVGEFPELQGVMGRYYALHDGLDAGVAQAIADHYSPAGPSDATPSQPVSVAVALADRIDTLVGFFGINEKPTGSKDPFALRRAALGVIRLITENGLRLNLATLFARAVGLYGFEAGKLSDDLMAFFADRLKVALRDKGERFDLVNAVFNLGGEDDLVRLLARVRALSDFVTSDDGANLLAAFRRAVNIVKIEEKKDGAAITAAVDPAILTAEEEKTLFHALSGVRTDVGVALEAEDFTAAMAALARLRQPVDAFFTAVTVNADDKMLRANRLSLLSQIGRNMGLVADFNALEG